jgi:hypothetical protein
MIELVEKKKPPQVGAFSFSDITPLDGRIYSNQNT